MPNIKENKKSYECKKLRIKSDIKPPAKNRLLNTKNMQKILQIMLPFLQLALSKDRRKNILCKWFMSFEPSWFLITEKVSDIYLLYTPIRIRTYANGVSYILYSN